MEPGKPTLRSRLLVRLSALLLVLLLLGLLALTGPVASLTPGNRVVFAGLLFLAGAALVFSVLSLVQHNMLDLLSHIRTWATNLGDGRHPDPIHHATCRGLRGTGR